MGARLAVLERIEIRGGLRKEKKGYRGRES